MRWLAVLLLGLVLGSGATFAAFELHVVCTKQRTLVVWKHQPSLSDTYVDISTWGPHEFAQHPLLVKSLVDAGHGDLIARPAPAPGLFRGFPQPLGTTEREDPAVERE